MNKVCPLMSNVSINWHKDNKYKDQNLVRCIEEECSWWVGEYKMCVIWYNTNRTNTIGDESDDAS